MAKKLSYLHTKRGILAAVWSDKGLYELTFPYLTAEKARAKITTRGLDDGNVIPEQSAWEKQLITELEKYFQGLPTSFTVPIDWSDYSKFRLKALRFTAEIPFGQVASYGGVAASVGSPGAARAVGGAMHANRTPIVVPCHRVVGSDGSLTGFGGGLELKRELLALEECKKN